MSEEVLHGYFNPADDVQNIGRAVDGVRYHELRAQVGIDEVLIGVYDKLIYRVAPHLYSQEEYEMFEDTYRKGLFVRRSFYAVPKDVFLAHHSR